MFNATVLKQELPVALGGEAGVGVPIEIGEAGLNLAIKRTVEVFSRYKPFTKKENFVTPLAGMTYHICPEGATGVKDIMISPGIQPGMNSGLAVESQLLSGVPVYYGVGDTYMDIQYLDLRRRWIKTVSRELASDPDWAYVIDPETFRLKLYLYGSQQLFVDVELTFPHKDDLTSIPPHSHKWVSDWALTEAMLIVGRARRKYDKIPVAGTVMHLDGDAMVAEATSMQNRLLNEIQSSRADLFPRYV